MAAPAHADEKAALDAAQAAATKQGDTVRSLKALLKNGQADKVSCGQCCGQVSELAFVANLQQCTCTVRLYYSSSTLYPGLLLDVEVCFIWCAG